MDNESDNVENTVNQAAASSAKPDTGKRFLATLIDGIIVGLLVAIPAVGRIVGIAYWLLRDGFDFDFMDGRSLGKKIMKLRLVRLDGQKMDIMTSLKRNFTLFIPFLNLFEIYKALTDPEGRRIGDTIADTKIIEEDS